VLNKVTSHLIIIR